MEKVTAVEQPATPPTCTEDLSQLVALDPDQDGDIDGYACPTCGSVRPNTDTATNPDGDGVTLQGREETPMTEATATATETASAVAETASEQPALSTEAQAIVDAVVAKLAPVDPKPEEATEAATTEETAVPDDLAERIKSELRQEIVDAYGPPRRRGLVRPESAEGKPRHQMTDEEWKQERRLMADLIVPTAVDS